MQYSIRSRFRGALLGLAIGERLGKSSSCKPCLSYNQIEQQNSSSAADAQVFSLVELGMKSLIQQGRFDLADWQCALGKDLNLDPLQSIIATLPIALFYHENEIKLRQNLELALLAVGQEEPENRDGALVVGYAIAKSLQTQLEAAELISQTIAFLGESQTQIVQKLIQVKSLLEHNAGLEPAVTALDNQHQPSSQIAIAFYCCLSTLEDFRLSIRRTARQSAQPQLTSAITGALSGAYNGLAGIASGLKSVLASGMTTETEMLRLSDALVAVWSGVYEQAHQQADLTQIAGISAPRVMQKH
jgi:ADP-ribosylglycohydrolase